MKECVCTHAYTHPWERACARACINTRKHTLSASARSVHLCPQPHWRCPTWAPWICKASASPPASPQLLACTAYLGCKAYPVACQPLPASPVCQGQGAWSWVACPMDCPSSTCPTLQTPPKQRQLRCSYRGSWRTRRAGYLKRRAAARRRRSKGERPAARRSRAPRVTAAGIPPSPHPRATQARSARNQMGRTTRKAGGAAGLTAREPGGGRACGMSRLGLQACAHVHMLRRAECKARRSCVHAHRWARGG